MREAAATAIGWTRAQLDARQLAFLDRLPLTAREGEVLYVHASAELPDRWIYVSDEFRAARSLAAAEGARYVLSGHVHEPTLFYTSAAERPVPFTPVPGRAIPVPAHRRWLAVVGSVGQPRDLNTAACWAMLDLARRTLTFHRVPYDWRSAAEKIRRAGLPEILAAPDRAGGVSVGAGLELGTALDGFRLEERVHSGGMAVLYRVSGPDAGFPLLMKVPRLGHGEPASNLVSFEVEQMVLEALGGPHVPRFVAKGEVGRVPYLVMERVEGRSLQEWAARAPLPAAEVARLGAAVANAIQSLHLQDAVHLDVKPANVLIRPDGGAVLVDFGAGPPRPLPRSIGRGVPAADRLGPVHVAGAGGGRPLRSPQRPLRAGGAPVRAGHRPLPLRPPRLGARPAQPALAPAASRRAPTSPACRSGCRR